MTSPQPMTTIADLFPSGSRLLLTGGGRDFIERIGVEATRQVIHGVMMGENLRTQTEPLSRRRIAQISGAVIALFIRGTTQIEEFTEKTSELALAQLEQARRGDRGSSWPAQWILGLTDKSVQNVLRSNSSSRQRYVDDFEAALADAVRHCEEQFGKLTGTLGGLQVASGEVIPLDWMLMLRIATAIGSQTLTIRGSEKAIYGKLFERLILGSFLSILGFERVDQSRNTKTAGVFWLTDSGNERESDATLLLRPGKLARFDIGFIGPGNSEISKDKLSRYARELEMGGSAYHSTTFIVVDRLPARGRTEETAAAIGAEIVQMSMHYWPRDLAQRMGKQLGFQHELQSLPDTAMSDYLRQKLAMLPVQDYLLGVSSNELSAAIDQAAEDMP